MFYNASVFDILKFISPLADFPSSYLCIFRCLPFSFFLLLMLDQLNRFTFSFTVIDSFFDPYYASILLLLIHHVHIFASMLFSFCSLSRCAWIRTPKSARPFYFHHDHLLHIHSLFVPYRWAYDHWLAVSQISTVKIAIKLFTFSDLSFPSKHLSQINCFACRLRRCLWYQLQYLDESLDSWILFTIDHRKLTSFYICTDHWHQCYF